MGHLGGRPKTNFPYSTHYKVVRSTPRGLYLLHSKVTHKGRDVHFPDSACMIIFLMYGPSFATSLCFINLGFPLMCPRRVLCMADTQSVSPGWLMQILPHLAPGALSPAPPHLTLPLPLGRPHWPFSTVLSAVRYFSPHSAFVPAAPACFNPVCPSALSCIVPNSETFPNSPPHLPKF